jgi:hypothetical protein
METETNGAPKDFDSAIDAEIAALAKGEETPQAKETPPAPAEEAKAEPDAKVEEPPKEPEAKKEPPGSLAKRLAMVAREDRRISEDRKRLDAEKAENERARQDAQRLERVRKAPDKVQAIREIFGGDDEAVAELFLQLNKWHAEGETERTPEQQRQLSEAKLQELIASKVAEQLAERDKKKQQEDAAKVEEYVQRYGTEVLTFLDVNKRKFPRCYVAPPEPGTIIAVGEELHRSLKRVPTAEEVLKEIEAFRAARAKEVEDPPETRTAAPNGAETGGNGRPNTPIRRDDAPVTPPRVPQTFEEAIEQALKEEGLA